MSDVVISNSKAKMIITTKNFKDLSGIVMFLKNQGVASICFSQVELSVLSSENHAPFSDDQGYVAASYVRP